MKLSKLKYNKLDILVLLLLPLLGVLATILLRFTYLNSILFFLGFPVLYLAFKVPKTTLQKTGIFALIFSLPLSVIVDYIITADKGWFVPNSIFRFLNIVPIEDLVFGFLSVWSITIIYEYFLDQSDKKIYESKIKYLMLLILGLLLIFSLLYLIFPSLLYIPYAFLIICTLSLLTPLLTILFYYPKLTKKYTLVAGYFFLVSLCWELSALYINQWQYLGNHYIGWLQIFHFTLPLEEFIFFWIVYAAAILAWYEFFDDDCK